MTSKSSSHFMAIFVPSPFSFFGFFCRRHRRATEWSFPRVGTTWKSSRGKPSHRLSSRSGQDHCSLSYGGFKKWNLVDLCFHPNKRSEENTYELQSLMRISY